MRDAENIPRAQFFPGERAGRPGEVEGPGAGVPFNERSYRPPAEVLRTLVRPGGRVVCLELTQPRVPLWAPLFGLYFGRAVPLVGRMVAGDAAAYSYLPESVAAFLRPEAVAAEMARAGLTAVRWRRLGLGTVTLHVGTA